MFLKLDIFFRYCERFEKYYAIALLAIVYFLVLTPTSIGLSNRKKSFYKFRKSNFIVDNSFINLNFETLW